VVSIPLTASRVPTGRANADAPAQATTTKVVGQRGKSAQRIKFDLRPSRRRTASTGDWEAFRSHLRDHPALAAGTAAADAQAQISVADQRLGLAVRKLIEFDEDTFAKLKQLARDRMATFQELADEAFADLMKKHGIPIDLRDALKKSAKQAGSEGKTSNREGKKK
jgi:hypothetical protein